VFSKGDLHGIERLEDHQDQEGVIERVEDAPGQRAPAQRVAPDRKAQAHQEHCRSAGQKNTESDVDDVLHQGEKAQAIRSRVVIWEESAFPDAAMVTPSAKRGVVRFRIRRSNPAASARVAGP